MNQQTSIYAIDDNLIKCVEECLMNVSSISNIVKNLSENAVKSNIKKESLELNNDKQPIIKKNIFEIIVNSILVPLGNSQFKIEKTFSPEKCPSCRRNQLNSFEMNYIKINLENYLGTEFNLDDFIKPLKGETKCIKCKQQINSELNFTLLPEILIIIVGLKTENKYLKYKYNTSFKYIDNKSNNVKVNNYILKGLVGQVSSLKYKSFTFNNENTFKKILDKNKDILLNPIMLFYEGPKKKYNEDNEYLEPDDMQLEEKPSQNSANHEEHNHNDCGSCIDDGLRSTTEGPRLPGSYPGSDARRHQLDS